MNEHFDAWRKQTSISLKAAQGFHPKDLILEMSDSLLAWYEGRPLLDKYDVYQHLMDYWMAVMQDDCYLIADGGWKAETHRIVEKDKKGREKDKGWAADLVPKELVVDRYYAKEQAALNSLEAELESVSAQLAELEEEHGGDEGVYAELDKVNKANVAARLKELKADKEARDEIAALNAWLKLNELESDLKKSLKELDAELDRLAYAHYPRLTEDEIKSLVIDDHWLATLERDIHTEMDRISQRLTQRVKELAERYETPLPALEDEVAKLVEKVQAHLQRMGFAA